MTCFTWIIALALAALAFGCTDLAALPERPDASTDGDADTDADTDTDSDADTDSDSDADTDADSDDEPDTDTSGEIGAPCTCEGDGCVAGGAPPGGTIVGCESVAEVTGTELVCLTSTDSAFSLPAYFANGYCALMATDCTGDEFTCNQIIFGEYEVVDYCPEGTVKLEIVQEIDNPMGGSLIVYSVICVKSCSEDSQCRTEEIDPVWDNEPTQYTCVDEKAPVRFCYDPRNLAPPVQYTAMQY